MTDDDARRRRRARSQDVFDDLAVAYEGLPGVDRRAMFGSRGLRYGEKFFAFVGGDGELIVKVPEDRVDQLVEDGATRVRIGGRPAREWVSLAVDDAEDCATWRAALVDAHRYLVALRWDDSL